MKTINLQLDPRRSAADRRLARTATLATLVTLAGLAFVCASLVLQGLTPTRLAALASSGITSCGAVVQGVKVTLQVMAVVTLVSVPIALGAALYIEEYAPDHWVTRALEANINVLARIPPVLYGVIVLALAVRTFGIEGSLSVPVITLSFVLVPILVLEIQYAMRAVPLAQRQAAWALGATRWQVVRQQVLPQAAGDIVRGIVIGMARIIGEAAPLIFVASWALVGLNDGPTGPDEASSGVLAVRVFAWISQDGAAATAVAGTGVAALLLLVLALRLLALPFGRHRGDR
jgi:phosphate transport system permease protein